MADKIEFLRRHSLFQRFSDADIYALARISEELEYVENGIIAYQGDVADALIIVKSGYIYAEQRRFDSEENEFVQDSVRFLPNEYLGDLWLFEPAAHTHTLRAHGHDGQPPRIIVVRSHNFLHLLSSNPALVPKCAPVADRHGRLIGGFRPAAWADARKMLAKADRKSSAVSILPDELVEYNSRRSYCFFLCAFSAPFSVCSPSLHCCLSFSTPRPISSSPCAILCPAVCLYLPDLDQLPSSRLEQRLLRDHQ